MTPPTDRFPTDSPTGSFRGLSQHRFPVPSPTGTGTGATESHHRFPHPMKGTPMNTPEEHTQAARSAPVMRQNNDGSWSPAKPLGWQEEHNWWQRLVLKLRGIEHCSDKEAQR